MFWFCKTKPINVHFFTAREDVFYNAKPERAIKFLPKWFKNMPTGGFAEGANEKLTRRITLKKCPGIIDLYKSGFVFPLWSDLNIEINPDGSSRYQFIDEESSITYHPAAQMPGCPLAETHVNAKINVPWFCKTDKNIKFLHTPPTWNNFGHGDIVVAQGLVGVYAAPIPLNIHLFLKRKKEKVIHELPFGFPLAHFIPLTDRGINIHHELVTSKELQSILSKRPFFLMGPSRYRRIEKLCPHA